MPRILFLLFVICYLLSVYFSTPVFAADQPTCDLCGWCSINDAEKPSNWLACKECLYTAGSYPKPTLNPWSYYTVIGCTSTRAGDFVKTALQIAIGIAGGIGFLAFLGGSALVLTSSGDPERLKNGKDTIVSSLLGLLLIVFSVFLLRVIGYDILKIPGFGG